MRTIRVCGTVVAAAGVLALAGCSDSLQPPPSGVSPSPSSSSASAAASATPSASAAASASAPGSPGGGVTSAPPGAAGSVTVPARSAVDASAQGWTVTKLTVSDAGGHFAGQAVVRNDSASGTDPGFRIALYHGADQVGALTGAIRDLPVHSSRTVTLTSTDPWNAGPLTFALDLGHSF